jgi:hypothetical protein
VNIGAFSFVLDVAFWPKVDDANLRLSRMITFENNFLMEKPEPLERTGRNQRQGFQVERLENPPQGVCIRRRGSSA